MRSRNPSMSRFMGSYPATPFDAQTVSDSFPSLFTMYLSTGYPFIVLCSPVGTTSCVAPADDDRFFVAAIISFIFSR
jgi:hypothetical protein